jgi:hypothetical protein
MRKLMPIIGVLLALMMLGLSPMQGAGAQEDPSYDDESGLCWTNNWASEPQRVCNKVPFLEDAQWILGGPYVSVDASGNTIITWQIDPAVSEYISLLVTVLEAQGMVEERTYTGSASQDSSSYRLIGSAMAGALAHEYGVEQEYGGGCWGWGKSRWLKYQTSPNAFTGTGWQLNQSGYERTIHGHAFCSGNVYCSWLSEVQPGGQNWRVRNTKLTHGSSGGINILDRWCS